jgi:putative DNA methylase
VIQDERRMGNPDLRLIEDYLPIQAISAEASREKSIHAGHISTLHLWWARRPLVACRGAVYGALVPADRWVDAEKISTKNAPGNGATKIENWKNGSAKGLNRKAAKEFVERLCRYPGDPQVVRQAQGHILEAHAQRLTSELVSGMAAGKPPDWVEEFTFTGKCVTCEDIIAGRAPRPRVLDMFAGGGAIPLEALRLGCDASALDLNPVAHIVELCTLVYPQKYGKPDRTVRGMTGPNNERGEPTWGGLASEVQHWGNWVLEKVKAEIGDMYPSVADPAARPEDVAPDPQPKMDFALGPQLSLKATPRRVIPVAYIWTRTVQCVNPGCAAEVPLVRQTWLCRKKDRLVAVKLVAEPGAKRVRTEIVEADTIAGLGFDPSAGSKGGGAACLFCGTTADDEYVRECGVAKRIGARLLAVVCIRPGARGKVYVASDTAAHLEPNERAIQARIEALCKRTGLTVPSEPIGSIRPSPNARGLSGVTRHGLTAFGELFSPRQQLVLLAFASAIRQVPVDPNDPERSIAIADYCGAVLDKVISRYSTFTPWDASYEKIVLVFGKHMLPMVWDYAEAVPIEDGSGGWNTALADLVGAIKDNQSVHSAATCWRGSAIDLPAAFGAFDAIITDPPYYDNIPYADISDFFYVWLKRSVGQHHVEHFTSELTPKKSEATALASRHRGDMALAKAEYEGMMLAAFERAAQLLKPGGPLVIVYAHKTTLGWSTLVDALRKAGFSVVEAWPLDTEYGGHLKADTSSLSSSIFLVARRRQNRVATGNYETDVRPDLEKIVRERVETLWGMGITGADLIIAAVGAGLRAFTRYEKVEYANGEEVPAEKFLVEVESVVLDTMMAKLFGVTSGNVATVDAASRFYVLWRFVYKAAEIDAGEAIVFTYAQHVELDGANGLSGGKDALVEKKKAKYRVRDFAERGSNERLGLPGEDDQAAPLVDILHRTLWLMEHRPQRLADFLDEAQPHRERLRVLAQALAGAALSGKTDEDAERLLSTTAPEQAALAKLLANWKSLIPDSIFGPRK